MTPTLPVEIFDVLVFLAVVVPFALLVRRRNAIPKLPALERGGTYTYTVRAAWNDGGQMVSSERVVNVTAGSQAVVDFTK